MYDLRCADRERPQQPAYDQREFEAHVLFVYSTQYTIFGIGDHGPSAVGRSWRRYSRCALVWEVACASSQRRTCAFQAVVFPFVLMRFYFYFTLLSFFRGLPFGFLPTRNILSHRNRTSGPFALQISSYVPLPVLLSARPRGWFFQDLNAPSCIASEFTIAFWSGLVV